MTLVNHPAAGRDTDRPPGTGRRGPARKLGVAALSLMVVLAGIQAPAAATPGDGGTPRPSAHVRSNSFGATVKIDAFPDKENPTIERLSLSWMYPRSTMRSASPDFTRAASLNITRLLESATGPQWISRNGKLDLTAVDLEGDEGHIKGTFSAELCYVEKPYDDPDESTCQPISGAIDTKMGPLN